jgi:hypothetical protein
MKCISLLLLSRLNIPKHCYGISFREVAALTEVLKELAADSKLESEAILFSRLEPFVTI